MACSYWTGRYATSRRSSHDHRLGARSSWPLVARAARAHATARGARARRRTDRRRRGRGRARGRARRRCRRDRDSALRARHRNWPARRRALDRVARDRRRRAWACSGWAIRSRGRRRRAAATAPIVGHDAERAHHRRARRPRRTGASRARHQECATHLLVRAPRPPGRVAAGRADHVFVRARAVRASWLATGYAERAEGRRVAVLARRAARDRAPRS